eukprot:1188278-Prorocentrum_minimum.AAC.2
MLDYPLPQRHESGSVFVVEPRYVSGGVQELARASLVGGHGALLEDVFQGVNAVVLMEHHRHARPHGREALLVLRRGGRHALPHANMQHATHKQPY